MKTTTQFTVFNIVWIFYVKNLPQISKKVPIVWCDMMK